MDHVFNYLGSIVSSLNEIYRRKTGPTVRRVPHDLVKPQMVASFYFATDVVFMTNGSQVFFQASRVNFLSLPNQVKKRLGRLNGKFFNPNTPEDCYFLQN